jgi:DNA-binding PadR family transcriptional regulator
MKKLTLNEQIYLIAVWHLKDEAYGIKIREKIEEMTGTSLLFGTLYNTLDSLVRKNLLFARKRNPEEDSQNTKRVYYEITPTGIKALQEAWELQKNLWEGFTDLPFKVPDRS